MKNYSRQKNLIVETVSALPTTGLYSGRLVRFGRSTIWQYDANDGWTKFSIAPDVTKQIAVSSNIALDVNYNFMTIIVTASCTITVPSTLPDDFQISGYVRSGQTLNFASSGVAFVGNNSVTSVASQKTFTLMKINGTTDFILKIEG